MAGMRNKRLCEHIYDGCGYAVQLSQVDDGCGTVSEDIEIIIANNGYYEALSLKQLNKENDGLLLKVLKGANNGKLQSKA